MLIFLFLFLFFLSCYNSLSVLDDTSHQTLILHGTSTGVSWRNKILKLYIEDQHSDIGVCSAFSLSVEQHTEKTVIVTAAHCVEDYQRIVLETGHRQYILHEHDFQLFIFPLYKKKTSENPSFSFLDTNDLAVLVLNSHMQIPEIQPLRFLKIEGRIPNSETILQTGHGLLSPLSSTQDLRIIEERTENMIQSSLSTFMVRNQGKGTCSGDSGSPLIIHNPRLSEAYVIGLLSASNGDQPGREFYLSIYTNLGYFEPWFKSILNLEIESFTMKTTSFFKPNQDLHFYPELKHYFDTLNLDQSHFLDDILLISQFDTAPRKSPFSLSHHFSNFTKFIEFLPYLKKKIDKEVPFFVIDRLFNQKTQSITVLPRPLLLSPHQLELVSEKPTIRPSSAE